MYKTFVTVLALISDNFQNVFSKGFQNASLTSCFLFLFADFQQKYMTEIAKEGWKNPWRFHIDQDSVQ